MPGGGRPRPYRLSAYLTIHRRVQKEASTHCWFTGLLKKVSKVVPVVTNVNKLNSITDNEKNENKAMMKH